MAKPTPIEERIPNRTIEQLQANFIDHCGELHSKKTGRQILRTYIDKVYYNDHDILHLMEHPHLLPTEMQQPDPITIQELQETYHLEPVDRVQVFENCKQRLGEKARATDVIAADFYTLLRHDNPFPELEEKLQPIMGKSVMNRTKIIALLALYDDRDPQTEIEGLKRQIEAIRSVLDGH